MKNGWSKGLTKETDERVANMSKAKMGWAIRYKAKGKNLPCDNCGKSIYLYPHLLKEHKHRFCNAKCRIEFTKGKPSGRKGRKFSKKWRENLSKAHKGYVMPETQKIAIGNATRGQIRSPITDEHRQNLRESHLGKTGVNSGNWKGGITPLHLAIRSLLESDQWRNDIFIRDNWTCQECGKHGGNLEAHHKKEFEEIFQEFLKEYDQFSPYEDQHTLLRLATKWRPFWDIDNGETLCQKCHIKLHRRILNAA